MGNWSFGGNTAPRDRDTAIVQVKVKVDPDGTISTDGYTAIPCCLSSTPSVNDYCPKPYEKDSEEYKRTMTKLDGTCRQEAGTNNLCLGAVRTGVPYSGITYSQQPVRRLNDVCFVMPF